MLPPDYMVDADISVSEMSSGQRCWTCWTTPWFMTVIHVTWAAGYRNWVLRSSYFCVSITSVWRGRLFSRCFSITHLRLLVIPHCLVIHRHSNVGSQGKWTSSAVRAWWSRGVTRSLSLPIIYCKREGLESPIIKKKNQRHSSSVHSSGPMLTHLV